MKHFLKQAYDKLGIYHTPSKILTHEILNTFNNYNHFFRMVGAEGSGTGFIPMDNQKQIV